MGYETLADPAAPTPSETDTPTLFGDIPYVEIREGEDEASAPPDWLVFAHFTEKVASA